MENTELLQAMQAMMKEEIGGLRQEMNERFEASEKRMGQMMDEKLAAQDKRTDEKLAAQDKRTDEKLAAQDKRTDEKLENALDPIHKKLTVLESLPKQINAIANGHANITRQMENLSAQVNSLEKKLDNSVIVKAVTPTI